MFVTTSRYSISGITVSIASFLLTGLFLGGCVYQGTKQFTIDRQDPEAIQRHAIDVNEYAEKYHGEDGVYLYREELVEMISRSPSMGSMSLPLYESGAIRYLVLNPDAEWAGTFELDVPPDKELKKAFVTVISPDGVIQQFKLSDLHVEEDADGTRHYRLAYPGIVRGSIVDEGFEIKSDPIRTGELHYSIPLQFPIPCERLSARIVYPDNWTVNIRGGEGKGEWNEEYELVHDRNNDVKIATYNSRNIPALRDESYAPYVSAVGRFMEGVVITAEVPGATVNGMSSSWDGFVQKAIPHFIGNRPTSIPKEVKRTVETIVQPSDSQFEKTRKILSWIDENIEPRRWRRDEEGYSVSDVLDHHEGRPSEITNLARLMLLAADINSTYVLAHPAEEAPVTSDFVIPGAFYISSLKAMVGDSTLYLFPYIRRYPVGQVPSFVQGQPALPIAEGTFQRFDTIPYSEGSVSSITQIYDVQIDEDGIVAIRDTQQISGDEAFFLRSKLEQLNEDDIEEWVNEMINYDGGGLKVKSYDIINRDEYDRPLLIAINYTIDGVVTMTPEEAIVRFEELFGTTSRRKTKVDTEMRQNPIRIYNEEEVTRRIAVHLPEEWRLQTLPREISESTTFGEASADYEFDPGLLTITYHRILHRADRPASDYPELLKLIGTKSRLNVGTMVFAIDN